MKHPLLTRVLRVLTHKYFKGISAVILLGCILWVAIWVRTEAVNTLQHHKLHIQFYGNDAYLHYWNAKYIVDTGGIPQRDMYRWLPIGRDNTQFLNLYAFALAYTYKTLTLFFSNITLHTVALYAPVVCFCFGLCLLCFFCYHRFGWFFATIVSFLLATMFGMIARSVAGFSDRDAWCWMLGVLLVILHIAALQTQYKKQRWILTIASGITMLAGGLSWEGFGVYLLILLFVESWLFLTSETDTGLAYYSVWVATFVPALYLISPAYRAGYGFSKHLAAFVLIPPLALLILRGIKYLLITHTPWSAKLRNHARTLSLGLLLTGLGCAMVYVLFQLNTFATTTVPFSHNYLMQSVGELQNPEHGVWVFRWGGIFVVASFGALLTGIYYGKKRVILPILALFIGTSLFRESLETLFSSCFAILLKNATTESSHLFAETLCHVLFFTAIGAVGIAFFVIAYRRKEPAKNEIIFVTMLAWFLCWTTLARDALRYDFYVGVAFAFFTAHFIITFTNKVSQKIRNSEYVTDKFRKHFPQAAIATTATCLLLALLSLWTPLGGHLTHLFHIDHHRRTPNPDDTELAEALYWIRTELTPEAIVAANWTLGSLLNVHGNVKTIVDQDHYLQYWIHLFSRHIYCAQSETETLEFLKTRDVTHLILTDDEAFYSGDIDARIGSDPTLDRTFQRVPLKILEKDEAPWRLFEPKQTPFAYINTPPYIYTNSLDAKLANGENVKLPCVSFAIDGEKLSQPFTETADNKYGGVLLAYDDHQHIVKASYLPNSSWNSLLVRLFMREDYTDAFVPIYPNERDLNDEVKIWEIHYPPDIKHVDKYLNAEPTK